MGTVKEWREVLVFGALWGGLMMLWQVFNRRSSGSKDPALYLHLLALALGGFFYGLAVTFGFRAFRWPLVTVVVPTIIAFLLVSIIYAKKLKSSQSDSPTIAG
jgi:peptidoglycan/LPS O-acetylase OafA/YrhL